MPRSQFRFLCLGLGSALVLLLVNGAGFWLNLKWLGESQQNLSLAQGRLRELQEMFSLLKDAESGQRGYLLTGKVRYLEPYRTAIAQMPFRISQLRRSPPGNPQQQDQLRRLEPAIAQKLAELRETIKLRQTPGVESEKAALGLVQTDRGQQLMEAIRRQVKALEAEQHQGVAARSQELSDRFTQTWLTVAFLNSWIGLILMLTLGWVWRDRRERLRRAKRERPPSAPDRQIPTLEAAADRPQLPAAHPQAGDAIAQLVERSRRTPLPPEPIDLIQIVEASLRQLATYLHGRNAEVRVARPLPIVLAHRPILLQAVTHLIDQALKSVPFDRHPVVQIYADEAPNSMCLWIEDNSDGAPLPDSSFSSAEPLQCSDGAVGLEIGLAIVREGVERLGGEIGVESQVGQGNRFWIALPTVDQAFSNPAPSRDERHAADRRGQ
jgi:CHASE3 domain sensor protein